MKVHPFGQQLIAPHKQSLAFEVDQKTLKINPINLIATNKVKCVNCQEYVQMVNLHQHLSSHNKRRSIFGDRNKGSTTAVNIDQKGSIPIVYINANYNYIQKIDVQTFNSMDIPQPQTIKRSSSMPRPLNTHITCSKPIKPINIKQPLNILQQSSSSTTTQQFNPKFTDRNFQKDDYYQRVNLNITKQTIKIDKKSVSLKKNKIEMMEKDSHKDKQIIKPIQQQKSQSPKYKIKEVSDKNSIDITKQTPDKSSFSLRQSHEPRISVIPSDNNFLSVQRPSRLTSTSKLFSSIQKPSLNNVSSFEQTVLHNHGSKCPCCQGFYCSYCKSTVPPQFRRPASSYHPNLTSNQKYMDDSFFNTTTIK